MADRIAALRFLVKQPFASVAWFGQNILGWTGKPSHSLHRQAQPAPAEFYRRMEALCRRAPRGSPRPPGGSPSTPNCPMTRPPPSVATPSAVRLSSRICCGFILNAVALSPAGVPCLCGPTVARVRQGARNGKPQIAKMKGGRTQLADKAVHVGDLEAELRVATTACPLPMYPWWRRKGTARGAPSPSVLGQ